jgi:xanthosine utilization system XapX-like protein
MAEQCIASRNATPPFQQANLSTYLPAAISTPRISVSKSEPRKIIAIPTTTAKLGSPFLRAYPPSLGHLHISKDLFLGFIDQLNRASVASPPVQVVGLVGNLVGMVPLATAQIVGTAVNTAATLTTVVVSKGRTEMVLRQANHEIFSPRGLKAYIAKLDALARVAKIPILDVGGNIDSKFNILPPVQGMEGSIIGVQERRIAALGSWIAPLDIESIRLIERPSNPLSRMHAVFSEKQRSREEEKLMKSRTKVTDDRSKDTAKAQDKYDKEMRKLLSKRKSHENLSKQARKQDKIEHKYQKKMEKVDRHRQKDDEEEKILRKLLFLVIDDAGSSPAHHTF